MLAVTTVGATSRRQWINDASSIVSYLHTCLAMQSIVAIFFFFPVMTQLQYIEDSEPAGHVIDGMQCSE